MAFSPSIRFLAIVLLAGSGLATSLPAAAGTVIRDDFSDTGSGWADNREAVALGKSRGLGIYDDNGHFQLTPLETNTMGLIPAPRQAEGGDVRMTSTMFVYVSEGKGGGGVFCRAKDRDNFYGFLLSENGGWSIVRVQNGDPTPLATGALPKQVVEGMVDGVLGAQCQGDTLTLRFKGKTMGSATDATFSEGQSD